ncbi:hypothetical protein F5I97DRAFT_1936936 [Phlebopus sp. FC_14]|nr:hypothetical protein F5I97DRAFT_1936936 [Phlebopus sp. FC_14]
MPPPAYLPAVLPSCRMPTFILRIDDLDHQGAAIFLDSVNPRDALKLAVEASYTSLYTSLSVPTHVNAISLVLRSFDGVAYTFGSHSQKEIHLSLDYIAASAAPPRDEILGVLVHEVVHCYQYNANGTCPSGLIEGIADFVRLNAGFVPPHWSPAGGEKWDAGYDKTAYFLHWLENRCGQGTIRKLNACMNDVEYTDKIFTAVTGDSVDNLWHLYCQHLENQRRPLN